jgi:hypothetical protein
MGGDVFVDSEMHVVTSSILKSNPPAQFFEGAHRGSVFGFIRVSVCACV